MDKKICVSILDSNDMPKFLKDIKRCDDKIKSMKAFKDHMFSNVIHFDIMDKKFVPCDGVRLEYIRTAKNMGFYVDTHLMVEAPIMDKYIKKVVDYGTDSITIHYEIKNFEAVLNYLNSIKEELYITSKRILKIGIALKPDTKIEVLNKYVGKFDKILFMSVEPGFGGQKYIDSINEKIKFAKRSFKNINFQVDGGVNADTLIKPYNLGVDSFVIGSYLSKTTTYEQIFNSFLTLNLLKQIEDLPKDSNKEFDEKILNIVKGRYAQDDILIGITVPNIRKVANRVYNDIPLEVLKFFINSRYHEYRKFALIVLSLKAKKLSKKADVKNMEILVEFMLDNIDGIDNWDLTDEIAPNLLGNYLLLIEESKMKRVLQGYLDSNNLWKRRIGIVSLITLVNNDILLLPLKICKDNMYDDHHFILKACGWVLREIYKKDNKLVFDFLVNENENRKIPNIVINYSTEKMSKSQKSIIRGK